MSVITLSLSIIHDLSLCFAGDSLISLWVCCLASLALFHFIRYETGLDKVCDVVYVVAVSPEAQLKRLAARDGAGAQDAKRRIAAQKLSAEDKALRANALLINDGTPEVRELNRMRACINFAIEMCYHERSSKCEEE